MERKKSSPLRSSPLASKRKTTFRASGLSTPSSISTGASHTVSFRKPAKKQIAELRNVFRIFDKNHDGNISRDELELIVSAFGLNEESLNNLMASIDTDKDGKISFEEFTSLMMSTTEERRAKIFKGQVMSIIEARSSIRDALVHITNDDEGRVRIAEDEAVYNHINSPVRQLLVLFNILRHGKVGEKRRSGCG